MAQIIMHQDVIIHKETIQSEKLILIDFTYTETKTSLMTEIRT